MDKLKNVISNDEKFASTGQSIESIIFEIILKHIKDLIYVMSVEVDGTFRYVFINDVAKGHAKLQNDCIGRSLQEVLHKETADHLQQQYASVLLKRQPISFQDVVKLADDRTVHGESILSPIFDDQGKVRFIVSVTRDITESVNEKKLIEFMAYHDHLTGLPNRSSLKRDLASTVEDSSNNHDQFALMYIDLDRFKLLNDTMGHLAGDQLLIQIAQRLSNLNSAEYKVYRQSGDEFIIILLNTTVEQARAFAENVIKEIEKPFVFNNDEYYVTTSLGISIFPHDGQDGETLIKNADTALYRAKEVGRSIFQFYNKNMQKLNASEMILENGLRKAIDQNELELYYQPQFNLDSNEVSSFEALLRWNHPTIGHISPAEFIPLAEDTGLILSIGEWVITTVCKKIKEWHKKGYKSVSVAVNLSAKQFQQSKLAEIIKTAIDSNQIDPKFLEFEITEGAIQDAEKALLTLTKLKEIGVQIAVDDFGTGYSSLSYLKRFPIDTLKIDQSFVKDVLTDNKDAAITTTIIHLAESLGLAVIAEGVEEQEQVEFFKSMNCHKAQGYFFSKPLPEKEIIEHYLTK
ncbi:sensor domain-containing protein [Ferdinandcohnia quinoae]|uniref:EAL domain-containing protein n=1 Tax=Fredinandcohnia quinoae TaxID=2918902 RepID=A0AAW5DUC2_9BACI|nr:GGDEF and EAL domain-containing protein [Fredinandcohnia sp. SECRCQ15]MCH1623963.1 EAL domain-containing protein [Fredinandcohnia sp. SECRCQ15]